MTSCCFFIPKYIEDKVNIRNIDLSPKTAMISAAFHCQRRSSKHLEINNLQNSLVKCNIYTAKNRRHLPGSLVAGSMNEASQSKDPDIVGAWTYSDYFIRFCRTVLGLNIFNGENGIIKSTVHYYTKYNNSFFNGSQLIYGDGDKITFEDFAQDPSAVFHELWHWITDKTCGLINQDQSGSLNDSLSDVFASIIMQWMNGETVDEASWLIGERCVIDINGVSYAVRSLADPGTAFVNHPYMGTDQQPQDMTQYYSGSEDNGGVHINSGIPNHAFYLFAKAIGGYSWDIPCKIWYKTITTSGLISPNATFSEFAQATITTATELYAALDSSIIDKLRTAWQSVKVL
jgi:Zn-dependent metalloprotease